MSDQTHEMGNTNGSRQQRYGIGLGCGCHGRKVFSFLFVYSSISSKKCE